MHGSNAVSSEVRMYDHLFSDAQPDQKFPFERHGYFVAYRVDHKADKPVFNLAVGLKDSWGK